MRTFVMMATVVVLSACGQASAPAPAVSSPAAAAAADGKASLETALQHWNYTTSDDPIRDVTKRAACVWSLSLKTTLCVEEWSNGQAIITIDAVGDTFTCTETSPCSLGARVDRRPFSSLLLFPSKSGPRKIYDVDGADAFIRGLAGGRRLRVETLLSSQRTIEDYNVSGFDLEKLGLAAASEPPDNGVNSADLGGVDR